MRLLWLRLLLCCTILLQPLPLRRPDGWLQKGEGYEDGLLAANGAAALVETGIEVPAASRNLRQNIRHSRWTGLECAQQAAGVPAGSSGAWGHASRRVSNMQTVLLLSSPPPLRGPCATALLPPSTTPASRSLLPPSTTPARRSLLPFSTTPARCSLLTPSTTPASRCLQHPCTNPSSAFPPHLWNSSLGSLCCAASSSFCSAYSSPCGPPKTSRACRKAPRSSWQAGVRSPRSAPYRTATTAAYPA